MEENNSRELWIKFLLWLVKLIVLFLENCENCLFLLIFVNNRRLNSSEQCSWSLSEENDNDDDSETSEHDPEYDCDSKAEPEDHNDSEDILTFLRGLGRMVIELLS